jgi:hypothetical protein
MALPVGVIGCPWQRFSADSTAIEKKHNERAKPVNSGAIRGVDARLENP